MQINTIKYTYKKIESETKSWNVFHAFYSITIKKYILFNVEVLKYLYSLNKNLLKCFSGVPCNFI